jgi:enoyl-CoA hydratase
MLGASALLAAAQSAMPSAPLSALGDCPYLLVDLGEPEPLERREQAALARWLRRQAAPVIGVAARGGEHPLACACDAVATSLADARDLTRSVAAAPQAAMILVQLLRSTEALEPERALLFESLAYATLQGGGEFRRWLSSASRPTVADRAAATPAVLLERRGARLAVCLNRPERRNALSVDMRDALIEALELVLADEGIAEVVISGAGKCFSSGGDLSEFGSTADVALAHTVRSVQSVPLLLARCAGRLTFRVHGAAVGAGAEIAAFGARVEACEDAFFQLPELRYGLIPGCGGCVSIPRRIGRVRAGYLALSGCRLNARTALNWGLVDALYDFPTTTSSERETQI